MRILIIGATGKIGQVAAARLEARDHDIIRASRTSDPAVDIGDTDSIRELFDQVGAVDSVVVASGAVPFKPLTELTQEDYLTALTSKTLAQINVAHHALNYLPERGSVTLTSGVIGREPIETATAAAAANGAIESFVTNAAAEAPRGIRINAVSPNVLANSEHYHQLFPGQRPVTDDEVGTAYVLAVEGIVNGRTIIVE